MLGTDIIAGTPGRLLHFLEEGIIDPVHLKIVVLDEADRILDDQFKDMVDKMRTIPNFPKVENLQTLLFSATFPPEVEEWAKQQLRPGFVEVQSKSRISANSRVKQAFVSCEKSLKKQKVCELLKEIHDEVKETSKGKLHILFANFLLF